MALTILGTLAAMPVLTSLGGVVLAVALAALPGATRSSAGIPRLWRSVYRPLVGTVLISIPIGLGLAWSRHR